MTYLSAALSSISFSKSILAKAKRIVSEILIPRVITRTIIRRYFERALRNGAWRILSREAKALLYVASKVVSKVRSAALKEVLREIFLEIEMAVTRGRALLVAVIHLAWKGLNPRFANLRALLALGVSILNHPLLSQTLL